MDWVKQVGKLLPDSYNSETIPEVGELDELETFVGKKKNKIWLWTAVDGRFKSELHHYLIYLYRIPHWGSDSQDIFEDDC
jgi:hypothetical protein